jgi:hypothetical protein
VSGGTLKKEYEMMTKEITRITYPVGTVLWRMSGREHEGKIYWFAGTDVIAEATFCHGKNV